MRLAALYLTIFSSILPVHNALFFKSKQKPKLGAVDLALYNSTATEVENVLRSIAGDPPGSARLVSDKEALAAIAP